MAISRAKKEEVYKKLSDIASGKGTRVFVNFHGLTVTEVTNLRQSLQKEGIGYFVAKKSLLRKAFSGSKIEGQIPNLPGELALAYGEDDIAPAREMYKFQKALKGKLTMLGGIFEGTYANEEHITAIATIPSREVLYGQFVNVINSPIQGLVMALDAIAKKREA